jgi:hypothetical protein
MLLPIHVKIHEKAKGPIVKVQYPKNIFCPSNELFWKAYMMN